MLRSIFYLIIPIILCFISIEAGNTEPLIVDHRAVDEFDYIPDVWIEKVKTMLIHYVGASHGRQLPYGLECLESQDPKYSVQLDVDFRLVLKTHLGMCLINYQKAKNLLKRSLSLVLHLYR